MRCKSLISATSSVSSDEWLVPDKAVNTLLAFHGLLQDKLKPTPTPTGHIRNRFPVRIFSFSRKCHVLMSLTQLLRPPVTLPRSHIP
jgi:hypothetical protein